MSFSSNGSVHRSGASSSRESRPSYQNRWQNMTDAESSPLPNGWRYRFVLKGDLDASYAELEGYDHFFADTMRGLVRSLQLRFEAAWELFDAAYEKTTEAAESIPNLVRQFLLNIYTFDNALMEGPLNPDNAQIPDAHIPTLPDKILDEYPEVRLVINLRRGSEGILRLHVGDFEISAEVFEGLLRSNPSAPPDRLAMPYIGLAAALFNLGKEDEARRNLENAAFAVQAGREVIGRGRAAAVLHAFHSYLGESSAAQDWIEFLDHLECPQKTRELFLQRAEIISERCLHHSSLVLL